ncbi:hypothetical protein [Halobacteriovorax sp. HLS]|uniref:hypothetical protein n=1 Tax=Halobacteriovorax sp. HLS TaxID=2234000 RepID=UPI0019D4D22A|nr:hypothetical protein [Halobacteriovorax sp. HLS]
MSEFEKGLICHACEKVLNLEQNAKIMRSDECPHCYANIHCCKMCDFYDKTAYNECRESNADRLVDKEMANFCDYFILTNSQDSSTKAEDLKNAADALFKN